jgi:DNA-directed RNA polymerase specialized sigma24 family protein
MMGDSEKHFARAVHTRQARLEPTIWRESNVTKLIELAREGGHQERLQLLESCVERFQFIVRQILQKSDLERTAPSGTEIVHDVFMGDLQAVLDADSIRVMNRTDFERLFSHKVKQHLGKLLKKLRREASLDAEALAPSDATDREHVGSDRIPRPDVEAARVEQEVALLDALDNYRDLETRDLLVQRYYFGRTLAELSNITGLPISTLHSRICAGEKILGRLCTAGMQELKHQGREHQG